MRILTAVILLAAACPVHAQIAAPGTWRSESFTFPLQFAPSIPYEGTEYVRFSPDWSDFASERGFTYVILWDVKRRAFEPAEFERALDVYFDGLMGQVTRGRKIADPGSVTSVSLHPLAAPEGWQEAFGGKLWTWNGFSRGEPLALQLEIAHRPCAADRTQIFFAFSRAERSAAAWDELRAIRKATGC